MPAIERVPLNRLLKIGRNAITHNNKETKHQLDMKIIAITIRSGHTTSTMAAIIANRIRITELDKQPIIIRKEALNKGIKRATLHQQLDASIRKLNCITFKQDFLNP